MIALENGAIVTGYEKADHCAPLGGAGFVRVSVGSSTIMFVIDLSSALSVLYIKLQNICSFCILAISLNVLLEQVRFWFMSPL